MCGFIVDSDDKIVSNFMKIGKVEIRTHTHTHTHTQCSDLISLHFSFLGRNVDEKREVRG